MKGKLILFGGIFLFVLLLGGAGFYIYLIQSELNSYRALGPLDEMKEFSQQNFDFGRENKDLSKRLKKLQDKFVIYRKAETAKAVKITEKRRELAIASFTPVSGPLVMAANVIQDQEEACSSFKSLVALESELFELTADAQTVSQQEIVCGKGIEGKITPLFKYQMIRVRASMTGSLSHLRQDAKKKFGKAKDLLRKWEVPVSYELDSYTRFRDR